MVPIVIIWMLPKKKKIQFNVNLYLHKWTNADEKEKTSLMSAQTFHSINEDEYVSRN